MLCPNCEHRFDNTIKIVSNTAITLSCNAKLVSSGQLQFVDQFTAQVAPNIRDLNKVDGLFEVLCTNCQMSITLDKLIKEIRCFTCARTIESKWAKKYSCQVATDMLYCNDCATRFVKHCAGCRFVSNCHLGKYLQIEGD